MKHCSVIPAFPNPRPSVLSEMRMNGCLAGTREPWQHRSETHAAPGLLSRPVPTLGYWGTSLVVATTFVRVHLGFMLEACEPSNEVENLGLFSLSIDHIHG